MKELEPTNCNCCSAFYGRVDRGTYLCCALHPKGPTQDVCQDFYPLKSEPFEGAVKVEIGFQVFYR